jgi:hypothetical protein
MSKKTNIASASRIPLVETAKDTPWFGESDHENAVPGRMPSYSGPLLTPIVPPRWRAHEVEKVYSDIRAQRIEKLILLLKHYDLANTQEPWLLLSLRLGCAFVPGLQVLREARRGRGRPKGSKKWSEEAKAELIAAVDALHATGSRAQGVAARGNRRRS